MADSSEIWNERPDDGVQGGVGYRDPKSGAWYISSTRDWLEAKAESATGEERKILIREIAALWQTEFKLADSIEVLVHFLEGYLNTEACNERKSVSLGRDLVTMVNIVREPMAMALGTPDDPIAEFWKGYPWPPKQSAFDKRLADWTRGVIFRKDVTALEALIKALKAVPSKYLQPGIDYDEFMAAIPLDKHAEEAARKNPVRSRFLKAFEMGYWGEAGMRRLPTKAELDAAAGVNDAGDCREHRRALGLQNLPKIPKRS